MQDFERIICNVCGGNIQFSNDGKTGTCKYCGSEFHFKEPKSPALALALNNAAGYLNRNDFDNAIVHYESILKEHPTDAEAAWGHVISTYGIVYAKDDRTNSMVPTCSRIVKQSILDNISYRLAIRECADEQRPIYEENATYIDKIQRRIKRAMEDEEDFDVFISFKATDENGVATEDSVIARNIYDELQKRGVKTFFSEVTLRNRFGDEYEPIIYRALYSCKFFILVATKEEYIEAPWVKNEWTRFRDRLVDEGLSGACSAVFRGISPYAIPRVFQTQGIDLEKHPFDYAQLVADNLTTRLGVNDKSVNSAPGAAMGQESFAEMLCQFEKNKKRKIRRKKLTIALSLSIFIAGFLGYFVAYPLIEQAKGNYSVILNMYGIDEFKVPKGTKYIEDKAFLGCSKIKSVTIPEGVTSIGSSAFRDCTSLTSIEIPDSVTSIDYYAFSNTAYYNDESNWEDSVLYIGNHLIEAKDTISGEYTIKSGTVTIAYAAFDDCTSLTSIEIPDSVTSIGYYAFIDCTSLTSIEIPDSVTSIRSYAFHDCESITSIEIPASVTHIGSYAFEYCHSLTDVYYTGNKEEWAAISIGYDNDELTNATIHYNYVPEE